MDDYILTKAKIEALPGLDKTHFLNSNARRINKSLGDLTGLSAIGFHIIEIEPGFDSTEEHVHYFEEECVYILEGEGLATIGDAVHPVYAGDFIGYRAGGLAHKLSNTGSITLKCIVVGQRLPHDVADYPKLQKRLYRNVGMKWNMVDIDAVSEPAAGKK
ncbi:MAG: cupin domain-containing protein [Pseudomonadales bacterium]|nr:cupin domain-containing protein [Pseudomonadales bacterium]